MTANRPLYFKHILVAQAYSKALSRGWLLASYTRENVSPFRFDTSVMVPSRRAKILSMPSRKQSLAAPTPP